MKIIIIKRTNMTEEDFYQLVKNLVVKKSKNSSVHVQVFVKSKNKISE